VLPVFEPGPYFGRLWKLIGWGWTEQSSISHWTIGDTIEIQYPGSGNFTDFLWNHLTTELPCVNRFE
jgi:hypothetical protein